MLRLLDPIFQGLDLELPGFHKGIDIELAIAEGSVRCLRGNTASFPYLRSLVSMAVVFIAIVIVIAVAIATRERPFASVVRGLSAGHGGRLWVKDQSTFSVFWTSLTRTRKQ